MHTSISHRRVQPNIHVITTREGHKVDISSNKWDLPCTYSYSTLDFDRVVSGLLKKALKSYVIERLIHTSTNEGKSAFKNITTEILPFLSDEVLCYEDVEKDLINAFEQALNKAKKTQLLSRVYVPIQWYIWSAKNNPELGFSQEYARQLSRLTIPGIPKGQAVKMSDPEKGPLDRVLELPLIIKALKKDDSQQLKHLQEKVAIALSIALARNPSNLTYLRESDLSKLTPFDRDDPTFILKVPRVKKRQLNPREDYKEEYLDPYFGELIEDLILANKKINLTYLGKEYKDASERPIFINFLGNTPAKRSNLHDEVFNMLSTQISGLLQSFVTRHMIISPITGKLLKVYTRRFRYTLATGLADEGISSKELARILDHSDTQNVMVYYDTRSSIVAHLDKALSRNFAQHISLFKGTLINSDSEAINGDREDKHLSFIDENCPDEQTSIGVCGEVDICHLDPPFSCYLCPKFQPYRSVDHEHILDKLLDSRERRMEKYENARLGIQLDDVILAVSNVIEMCRNT